METPRWQRTRRGILTRVTPGATRLAEMNRVSVRRPHMEADPTRCDDANVPERVATGHAGYQIHRDHRQPGTHPVDDGQFFASRHLAPVEGTRADHVFDGECPPRGLCWAQDARGRRMPSRASSLRSAPEAPLGVPGDLRRVAITGSLGIGDSGGNGSLGGRW
jgi:hypothetical protein